MNKHALLIALSCFACGFIATEASAHAELLNASPSIDATLRSPPHEVTIKFSEALEPAFSTIIVQNELGARVDNGDGRVDRADRMILRVTLKRLSPGPYQVIWRVISVDTHRTSGNYIFRVAP